MRLINSLVFIVPLLGGSASYVEPTITLQSKLIGPITTVKKVTTFSIYYPADEDNFYHRLSLCSIDGLNTYYIANELYTYFYPSTTTMEAGFSLPIYKYIGSTGLLLKLEIVDKKLGNTYISSSKVIYPAPSRTINTLAYKDDLFIRKNIVVDFSNKSITDETYDFRKIPTILTNNSRSQLLFDNIVFNYSSFNKYFTCKEVYLTTSDPCNLFSKLKNSDGNIKIPLTLTIKSNSRYQILLNGNRYVNKTTLEMSNTPLDDYIKTSDFYLPLNKNEELKSYPFEIHILGSGACNDHIVMPFTYEATVDLFDDCITSDFCVHGGVKE